MATRLIALTCVAAIFSGAIFAQRQVNATRPNAGDEILFLPNQKLLKHFTGGMNNVVADLLWLRCVQYVASESKGERNFLWLQQMIETVVQLDPNFGDAYRYGGMFLAALRDDTDAGIALLERGFINNPSNFQLPYELAMIFLLNRKDEPGAKERATHYLSMAAAIDDCPQFIRDLAVQLQGQYDLVEVEHAMWSRMADSDDRLLRELAQRKLVEIDIRTATEQLNKAVLEFNRQRDRFPESLDEMVAAGLIPPLGPDPLGGTFFMGEDGVIRNTTTLDAEVKSALKIFRNLINSYTNKHGSTPARLDDLVADGLVPKLPNHPYPGGTWQYDPATGEVR